MTQFIRSIYVILFDFVDYDLAGPLYTQYEEHVTQVLVQLAALCQVGAICHQPITVDAIVIQGVIVKLN